jgi:hypothetical protein
MVIRNARERINGREVGDWDDALDPFMLRMELVDLLTAAAKNDAIRPKAAPRRSNRK